MTTTPTNKQFKTRDVFLAAAVWAITGQEPATETERNLVIFIHESSDALNNAIATYSANGSVPAQDFVSCYKQLRQKLYAGRR